MDLPVILTRIVLAPMAGGPGTPELAAAVSNAGGLGFLPSGYLAVDRFQQDLTRVRSLTDQPFGVNVLVPAGPDPARLAAATAYARHVQTVADPAGLPTAPPAYTDDAFDAKTSVLLRDPPTVVSFTFDVPDTGIIGSFRRAGVAVMVTVTSPEEAVQAAVASADALVVQGAEAAAHQGGWQRRRGDPLGLLPLLQRVRQVTELPLVAAGGIATGEGLTAVLAAGAEAAMLGTAFLRCPESGTSPTHAAALNQGAATALTRAFTGRPARAIRNDFVDALDPVAPDAYPEAHVMTAPLRAEARRRHDPGHMHLWAGQAHTLTRERPAAEIIRRLTRDAQRAIQRLHTFRIECTAATAREATDPAMAADQPERRDTR